MKVQVAVFDDDHCPNRKPRAYTLWYNPEWPGYCGHVVDVAQVKDAKKAAIDEHLAKCRQNG